jgi:2-hydroxychromene-2-carboxylate isomerase
MPAQLDFFFFYGSIHTYLSAMRIGGLASSAHVEIRWRPFNLRTILIEQDNTSFAKNPVRLNYNWRDIERRAARLGVAFAGRAPYPVDPDLLALRVGVVAAAENWCAEYTIATFKAWFLQRKASGLPENVAAILNSLGKPSRDVVARASTTEIEERLEAETDAARQLGIFGSPTFAVRGEIFWGDDRLEDAIAYACTSAETSLQSAKRDETPEN